MKQLTLNLKAIFFCAVAAMMVSVYPAAFARMDDPLPAWNDGPAKESIVKFVKEVTTTGGAKFVPSRGRTKLTV
jgi:hypothetical protein